MGVVCSDAGCNIESYCKGLCRKHYTRAYRAGETASLPGKIAAKGAPLQYLFDAVLKHRNTKDCLIWPYGKIEGYGIIRYKGSTKIVSRLVCIKINGKPPTKKHEARHRCGNGNLGCVNPHHLEWGTHAENMRDTIEHGTSTKGAISPIYRLSASQVRKILRLRKEGWKYKDIADTFGVHAKTVAGICRGETWKHIKRVSET